MKSRTKVLASAFFIIFTAQTTVAKVYRNIVVGKYEKSYHLDDYKNQTFLNFVRSEIFPALNQQAGKQKAYDHITGVTRGEGVEVRLTDDVSTYHVKYKAYGQDKAERSGRSFSGVGLGPKVAYVADASYKHYLTTLDKYVKGPEAEVRNFYKAVLEIIVKSDASTVKLLSREGKEVLADFVAVYIAEQYRHMMSGNGQGSLGQNHNWDDAHLQVTLLAVFHGGQGYSQRGMFYEGQFTTSVYNQLNKVNTANLCVYKGYDISERQQLKKRPFNLTDYWQFNRACERSGVNLTRRDFIAMGTNITSRMNTMYPQVTKNLSNALNLKYMRNAFDSIADFFISNMAPASYGQDADIITEAILEFLIHTKYGAQQITTEIIDSQKK